MACAWVYQTGGNLIGTHGPGSLVQAMQVLISSSRPSLLCLRSQRRREIRAIETMPISVQGLPLQRLAY